MNFQAALTISRLTTRELLHERVSYLILMFAVGALGLSFLLGQLTYAERAKLTLSFLLAGLEVALILCSLFLSIWIMQRETAHGSIALVLSKGISRWTYLIGKFTGQMVVQVGLGYGMGLLIVATCKLGGLSLSNSALFQGLTLIALESVVMAAVTYFFAVITGPFVAGLAALSFFLLGQSLESLTAVNPNLKNAPFWLFTKSIIPHLNVFNMKNLVAYSLTLEMTAFGIALIYSVVCTVLYLLLATICFSRKDILT